ncbi:MAG: flippase [Ignavibacteriaceae bacterium]|nr:flippase [Ignavibacterium sp.]MCC6255106.1 flippase [Ignavibacteriaceae bacterium]HRP93042.1 flippase [Ignavibacteriaceae bacterium]HRQ55484.1 flippase [Ignavibacteriaceae bacterium]
MKRIFQKIESNKVLFKNFTSLSILQVANYIFPLVTLPYLVRVLGAEKYGLVNFAAAFAAYFTIITDYGFNLSATQEISVNRENSNRVSEIFSSVFTIKMMLFVLSSVIFFIIVLVFPIFKENLTLFIVTFLSVLGTALFPLWFYQGIERMKYILIISVSVRLITTILIFVLIKSENDFIKFAGLNTVTQFVIGIIGLQFALNKFGLKYRFPNKTLIIQQLKNGWNLFLSTISINLYTTSNVFILGLFAPANVVGYYAAADKIRMAFQGILSPMSQSVFPYVNKMLSESYDRFISFNKKLFKIALIVGAIISIMLFLFAEPIVNIILGKDYQPSILVLRIIAWLPLIIFLSNVLGIQTMLPMNKQKNFSIILFFAAMISLALLFILVPIYFAIGTAITALATEIFVTLAFFIFVKRNKIFAI